MVVVTLDVNFRGRPGTVASALLEDERGGGVTLVDPGPTSSLDGLRRALAERGRRVDEVEAILLTHIHLDHAGATGTIVRESGRARVYVHERGAGHLIDPSRLLASAARIYGDQMDCLWGEMPPVPPSSVHALRGGERIAIAGRELLVEYLPGHASHHVGFFDAATRTAFVGDTGGIRVGAPLVVMPPTPPPDVDLEAWDESLDRILAWEPERLFVTHFGSFGGPREHVAALRARLRAWAALVEETLADAALEDDQRAARFASEVGHQLAREVGAEAAGRYVRAITLSDCWAGLARYFRKR